MTFTANEPDVHHSLIEIKFDLNISKMPKKLKGALGALAIMLGVGGAAAEYHDAREGVIEFYHDLQHIAHSAMEEITKGVGHIRHVKIVPPADWNITQEEIDAERKRHLK